MKFQLGAALIGAAVAVGGLSLFANSQKPMNSILDPTAVPVLKTGYGTSAPAAQPVDFEKAASIAVPAVVHIKTLTKMRTAGGQMSPDQDPFGGFFQEPNQRASGSGVIISQDGYIVTNNHVVNGASEVTVTLNNRKNYTAKVIGTDPNTDLALIKIDGHNLPVMTIGNSDEVKLGEWVMAIGYPLNLDVTVTQGIVSAKSRNLGINTQGSAPVEAFIQTDAAVNPGSSGGALVNTNGELIAINSAIASPTGSFAGYAYSIPSNLMRKVIGDIMKYGKVERGYLGISMAPEGLDDANKRKLGINSDAEGVFVIDVSPKSAASEAGIRKGDVITHVNGEKVDEDAQLAEIIARQKPGDNVRIEFVRDGSDHTVTAKLQDKLSKK